MKHLTLTTAIIIICCQAFAQVPTLGLMAYWPMDGNFTDAGPNNIVVTNSGATAAANRSNVANKAMQFLNPASTVVQFAKHNPNANLSFGTAQDFSIDFAFYLNSPYVHTGGFYDNNLNYGGYGVWFWNSNGFPQLEFNFKNGSVGSTNGAITIGAWYHVCFVRASGTLKIYVNGVLNASAAEGPTAPVYSFPARFGSMFANSLAPPEYNGHNGRIDEMRIYNRALTLSEIIILSNLEVLKLNLTQFSISKQNDNVLLNWRTADEQNSSHFEVERSADGVKFSFLQRIAAAGNSSLPKDYSMLDSKTLNGTNFYRLKMVDIDGKYAYSNIIAIKMNSNSDDLVIFPNPVQNILQAQIASTHNETAVLQVQDNTGRILKQQSIDLNNSYTAISLNLANLQKGLYLLVLQRANKKDIKKFIKE